MEARFLYIIKSLGQFLEFMFYFVLGFECVKLEKIFFSAANWIDKSELRWEQSAAVLDLSLYRRIQSSKQGRKPKKRRFYWEELDKPEIIFTTKILNRPAVFSLICYLSVPDSSLCVDTFVYTNISCS